MVQKKCKYCGKIIENASCNQFYHKESENKECYSERIREQVRNRVKTYRKGKPDKICLYCGEIIKNASQGQLYHTEKQNKDCYDNRNLERSQESSETYRKRNKFNPNIDFKIGTAWLSKHPKKAKESDKIDFKAEYNAIQKEKQRLKL